MEKKMLRKCEYCVYKKKCIDGANYKYAEKCKRYIKTPTPAVTGTGKEKF